MSAEMDRLVAACCPEMPEGYHVHETGVFDAFYTIDPTTKTLHVPPARMLRMSLREIDRMAEALHNFAAMTPADFQKLQNAEYWTIDTSTHFNAAEGEELIAFLESLTARIDAGILDPYIAFDIETCDLSWDGNRVLLVGCAYQDVTGAEYTASFELPYTETDKECLQYFLKSKEVHFIWHNGKFDISRLRYCEGIEARVDEDTMLMHYVGINERKGTHGLKLLAPLYLGAPHWEDELDDFKRKWCRQHHLKLADFSYDLIPRNILVPYLHLDCLATLRLYHKFKTLMRPESLNIYRQLCIASNVYATVETNGVQVDDDYLEDADDQLQTKINEASQLIKKAVDKYWNPMRYVAESGAKSVPAAFAIKSPKQLKWLIETMIQQSVESTDADTIEKLAMTQWPDPLINDFFKGVVLQRKNNKYRDTYVIGVQEAKSNDGRVRCTYNLHGTETGRLSSSEPNMQNIPRDSFIKNIFVAPKGKVLVQLDYSQAELRVLAYLSRDPFLTGVYQKGEDLHDSVATQMFGPDFTKEQRVMAKTINFGIAYGRGPGSLSETFGLSPLEANKLIRDWYAPMPMVKKYIEQSKLKPFKNIPVTTVFGRQRSFIITPENSYHVKNEAVNMPIQSTASDCTLISLCNMQKWIDEHSLQEYVKIVITVHDSIVLECNDDADLIKEVINMGVTTMSEVPKQYLPDLEVPFVADAEVGTSWGEMKKWKSE